jgi:ATP-dependent RNA helicase DDX56/DBP9
VPDLNTYRKTVYLGEASGVQTAGNKNRTNHFPYSNTTPVSTPSILIEHTMTILDPDHTFASLSDSVGLDVRLKKAVSRLGHTRPTLVQSKCLPLAISHGRDLCVRARTGSGKTLAFCLPLLQKLLERKSVTSTGVGAVILVPTRELVTQIHATLTQLTYYCADIIKVAVLSVGRAGVGKRSQLELERQEAMLRDRPNVIVATPNGLVTHIRSGALELKTSVETVVVDEADLVLSFGYSKDIVEIMKALPRIYQGFLMSATLSPEIESLKKIVLHSPVMLRLEQDDPKGGKGEGQLKQFYIKVPREDRNLVLYVFLKLGLLKGKGLFFVNSTDGGFRLKLFLEQFHIRSSVLNAELPFRSRLNIIEQFNVGNFDYLIATDETADADDDSGDSDRETATKKSRKDSEYGVSRGLDFRNVSFVVNVDFPPNAKSYAHRVGRTARGGANGVALSLVDTKSSVHRNTLLQIQDQQPKVPISGASTDTLQARSENVEGDTAEGDMADRQQYQPQPVPLDFDLREIEGFRYRVEDVSRAVTKSSVREARAAELKAEILNSERLQSHFEDNPADLQLLRHDRLATNVAHVQDHLKHVPKYLLPRGMQAANLNKKRKKRKVKSRTGGERRTDNDPLQSFQGGASLDGVQGEDEDDPLTAEFMDSDDDDEDSAQKKKQKKESQVFANTKDGTGHSTSGRSEWKEKHRKGKFSGKKRSSERRQKGPLGI